MASVRLKLNRAGLFNFWHYTDEVFQLSDGRLIFRGANGSGKSVTMQSFLPLVLDGDKRPVRLDPFGSKDRKIEYYLLGDTDSSTQDRTGYLYLEFAQPGTEKYLTIGIGLRARRGAAQVGFWGFAITDHRRIGQDLFLYDVALYETHGHKVPLDRAGLEAVLGEGGKVVREQREYRNLVNQLLFGFADPDAYKELLALMIQLRSPKLSKEFRPGTIYGILNQALPPLGDEDLRPLAEVLEDLDQITDRLQELAGHRADAERLQAVYQQYNEMRLFQMGQRVSTESATHQEKERQVAVERAEWERLTTQYGDLTTTITNAEAQVQAADIEIDLLEHSKEMEQQRELEEAKRHFEDAEHDIESAQKRYKDVERDIENKRDHNAKLARDIRDEEKEQSVWRRELSGIAETVEFHDHALYEMNWQAETSKTDSETWTRIRNDIATYKSRLKATLDLIQQVRQQLERTQQSERALSEARERRDGAERAVQAGEKELQDAIVKQEDKLFAWYQTLKTLPMDGDAWRQVLRQLQKYPEVAYADVLSPIHKAHIEAQLAVQKERLEVEHEQRQCVEQRETLTHELERWRSQRDAEPERSEATLRARARRRAEHTSGVRGGPLYTLCEFQPNLDEAMRSQLETVLHRAGLLDAWVGPLGWQLADGEEDAWIRPNPAVFGMTLADLLRPTPTEESGLTATQIDEVLRTIVIGENSETGAAILDGQFHIGPLTGQVVSKARAEWIGYETRKQTRLMHIRRLEEEVAAVNVQISAIETRLAELETRLVAMAREVDMLPAEDELRDLRNTLRDLKWDLEREIRTVDACTEQFKGEQRRYKELQSTLLQQSSDWNRLKTEADFQDALDKVAEYQDILGDLKSSFTLWVRYTEEAMRLRTEIANLEERMEHERDQLLEYQQRRQNLLTRISTLETLLAESGAMDVYQRLESLKAERITWKRTIDSAREEREQCNGLLGGSKEKLSQRELELADVENRLHRNVTQLTSEIRLGFVALQASTESKEPTDGAPVGDDLDSLEAAIRISKMVVKTFKSRYESRRLENITQQVQEVFSIVKNSLVEYALEQRYEDQNGRLFIESLRDRNQPLAPEPLLQELRRLEEQQRVLIDEKDRELYEHILLRSVGRAIRDKINRAEQWVAQMNQFMAERKTSSGLVLSLAWLSRAARNERELDTDELVRLLRKSPDTLRTDEVEEMMSHFRSRIHLAKEAAAEGETLRQAIHTLLDYRTWFNFELSYKKGDQQKRVLTDARFNVLSGGEKAMAMYIPLFAATDSRYKDSRSTAPRMISLDEAFAGVDEENMRDMFQLLTDMKFDYMMTSQQLWGCYDTVPSLSIYEIHRPNDADFITLIPYYWNGEMRRLVVDGDWHAEDEVAASFETDEDDA